jgi:ribosomal protein RSM22 (predicted rRNA methylase)
MPDALQRLFSDLSPEAAGLLDGMLKRFKAVVPLKGKHLAQLPKNVSNLSEALTAERSRLPRDYMGAPATLNAYLQYFLPWSVYRLSRLLPALDLGLRADACILDLGAGPLALAQALWIARPELRDANLRWLCRDKALKAMRLGRDLLERMTPKDSPWRVHVEHGSFGAEPRGQANLAASVNLLNEIFLASKTPEADTAARAAEHLATLPNASGRLLLVEPGTRTAARQLVLTRSELMENGFRPLAPCPHDGPCPMPGRRNTPWCHFVMHTRGAPRWLTDLSAKAGLSKQTASLSFLLMGRERGPSPEMVRVISESFDLPETRSGQYGCSSRGLVLLARAKGSPMHRPGDALPVVWPEKATRDAKSGALVLEKADVHAGH